MVRLLEIVGFEVREAINGSEAIALWSSWSPNLILMDLQMPVMDGYEAIQHIKRSDKSVVIIAITASKFKEQKQFILSSGCDDLMNLPFLEEDLWSKIAHHFKVKYIYETPVQADSVKSKAKNGDIEPKTLSVMSPEWIGQLNDYATAANAKEIYSLLEEVPEQYLEMVKAIAFLADDFCFEQIIELASASINYRSII